jgi:hypothetical protein
MVNTAFSQLNIASTLLGGASEQIADAAEYLEKAGDQLGSRELQALNDRAHEAIRKIEAQILQSKSARTCEAAGHE